MSLAAREWAAAWLNESVACICSPHEVDAAAAQTPMDLYAESSHGAELASHGLHEAVGPLLFEGEAGDSTPLALQVLEEAAHALLLRLAAAVLPAVGSALSVRKHQRGAALDNDGSVLLALDVGGRRVMLSVDGDSVAHHAPKPTSEPFANVMSRCLESLARHEAVLLEFVVGEVELSVQALQRAEVNDVILLDATVDLPLLLRAPAFGLAWPAYLGQHGGRRVAETAHAG